jgi:hypothetical protein
MILTEGMSRRPIGFTLMETRGDFLSVASRARVDRILENYLLALAGADQCAASAPEDLKIRLTANVARAERAWSDASADGLVDELAAARAELAALVEITRRGRESLNDGLSIADLLETLEAGTDRAVRIVDAALGRG